MSTNPRLKRLQKAKTKTYKIERDMYLSPEERKLTAKALSKYPGRDSTLLLTILSTGGRPQEVLNLLKTDLHTETIDGKTNYMVHLTGLKDSNDRDIPVDASLFRALSELVPDQDGFVFDIKYRRVEQLWRQYRPVKKPIKAMRHGFAVFLYEKTKDILLVQKALGHKSIANTLVYAHLVDGRKQLKEGLGL